MMRQHKTISVMIEVMMSSGKLKPYAVLGSTKGKGESNSINDSASEKKKEREKRTKKLSSFRSLEFFLGKRKKLLPK